ncbi:MAG TPA: helix-turn-helix domain-containing protein [Steroidobacteraceae bacterium]|jgi:AcrR family transcriptional regulator|nr:helix-turn-helix domain-containing protein [Steroidobacteraceae bacterium]
MNRHSDAGTDLKAAATRLSARERLLAAADELFYENGINLVGIDRLIEHAGVAKASLYDSFGSKQELIRCYLQARSERRQARIRARMAQFKTPQDKILSAFDLLGETVAQPNYRGCPFQRAAAEAGAGSTIKGTCDASRAWIRREFTELARAAGARDPEHLGRQLVLLYDGAAAAAHMDRDLEAPQAARALAEGLLSVQISK